MATHAELVAARNAKTAPKIAATPAPVARGPRISLLQSAQTKQETIRAASPAEVALSNDPVIQARNKKILDSTSGVAAQKVKNNTPELSGLRAFGQNLIDKADALDQSLGTPEGLSPGLGRAGSMERGSRMIGNTITQSVDTIADFVKRGTALLEKPSAKTAIDVGVGMFNLGAIPFIAATELVGAAPIAGKAGKAVVEAPFKALDKVGSYILGNAYKGYYNAFTGQNLDPQDEGLATAEEVGGLAGIMFGAGLAHTVMTEGGRTVRSGDPKVAASIILGLPVPKIGEKVSVTPESIDVAYKKGITEVTASGKDIQQKTDMLTVAHRILMDHATGNIEGVAKWDRAAQRVEQTAPAMMNDSMQIISEMSSQASSADTTALRKKPIEGRTPLIKKLDEAGKLTFEAEFETNFQQAVDTSAKKGTPVKITDIPFDTTPGTFDPATGEIVINKHAVKNLIDRAERGERIMIGSNEQAYVLERKAGESRDALEKRVIEDIIKHEKAHADTVTPEDAAALQSAIATGDRRAYDLKMQELENKANSIRSVRGVEEPGVIDAIAKETDRIQTILSAREQLKSESYEAKYNSVDLESGYKKYQNLAKNNPDILSFDLEGLQKKMETRPQYRGKSMKKELGLDTVTHNDSRFPSGTSNDSMLTMFKERFAREAKLRELAKENIQSSLPKMDNKERAARIAVQREVKRILSEERAAAKEKTAKNKRMAQFNDIVTSREAVSTGKEGQARKLAAQENRYRGDLEAQKTILSSEALLDRAVLRMQKDAVIAKLRDEKVTDREARGAIVNYLKESIPKELRATVAKDFLVRIRDATSKSDLNKIFREIDQRYNKAKRTDLQIKIKKTLKDTILKRVNGLAQAKFGKAQPKLDAIREGALKGSRVNAFRKMLDGIQNAERDASGNLPDSIVEQNQILQTFGIKEQTVAQLERTFRTIEELKDNGRTELSDKRKERQARQERNIHEAKNVLTGGKPIDTGIAGVKAEGGNRFRQAIKDHFNFKSAPFDFIMDRLSMNDRKSEAFNSPLNRMADAIARDRYAAEDLDRAMEERRNKMVQEAYGKKGFTLYREWKKINAKKESVGTFIDGKGKSVDLRLTRAEKMNIYAESKNTATRSEILDRNNFTGEMLLAVEKSLNPRDKKFADSQFDYYAQHYQAFADTFYEDTGAMLPKADNYIPRWAEGAAKTDVTFASLLADDIAQRISIRPGSARGRTGGGEIKFSYDPLSKMRDYSTQVNHYISTMESVKDLRSVFTNPEVRSIIRNQWGDIALTMIDHHIGLATRGGVDGRLVNKWLSGVSSRVTRAFINTPSVVLGQPSSNAQFMAASNSIAQFGIGLADFARNPARATKLMREHSSEFRIRNVKGGGRHIEEAKVEGTMGQLAQASKIMDFMEMPLQAADYFGIAPGGWAIFRERFNESKAKGFSDAKSYEIAGRYLDRTIRTTQSVSGYTGKSYYETSGTLNKMFSILQNQPNKVFQVVNHTWANASAGRISYAKAAKITAVYAVVLPVLYTAMKRAGTDVGQGISDAIVGTSEEDKQAREKKKEPFGSQVLRETIAQPFTSPIIVGQMVKSAIEWSQGKSFGYRPGVIFSIADTTEQAFIQISSGDIDTAMLYGLKALSMERGIPYSQQILQTKIRKANAEFSAAKKTPSGKMEARRKALQKKFAK